MGRSKVPTRASTAAVVVVEAPTPPVSRTRLTRSSMASNASTSPPVAAPSSSKKKKKTPLEPAVSSSVAQRKSIGPSVIVNRPSTAAIPSTTTTTTSAPAARAKSNSFSSTDSALSSGSSGSASSSTTSRHSSSMSDSTVPQQQQVPQEPRKTGPASSKGGRTISRQDEDQVDDSEQEEDQPVPHRHRHHRHRSSSKKKRERGYYVLEHELERPPRRRTRPMDDGETIGDALFFGDDAMYGTVIQGKKELRLRVPWPERLRGRLVNEAGLRLVMGGLPGRTSRWEDEVQANKVGKDMCKPSTFSGLYQFGAVFSSHSPLWVVLALGTNDLKTRNRQEAMKQIQTKGFTFRQDLPVEEVPEEEDLPTVFDADTVARAVGSVALRARRLFKGHCHEGTLRIVVVVPPQLNLTAYAMREGFDAESVRISKDFPVAFTRMCKEWDLKCVNPTSFQKHSWPDGVHPTDEAAQELAEMCWETIAEELPRRPRKRMAFTDTKQG